MPIICGGRVYNNRNTAYSDQCLKYSPATDTWWPIGTMPYARAFSASTYMKNFGLVMAGGYNDGGSMDSVIVTKNGSSFVTLEPLPAADYFGCLAVVDEQTLLLTGGSRDESGALTYDIPTDTWTRYFTQKIQL